MLPSDIFRAYYDAAHHYAAAITPYALRFWFLLTFIELTTLFVTHVLDSQEPSNLVRRLVRLVLTSWFAYWWITNSWSLGMIVLGSFNELGSVITGVPGLTPLVMLHAAASIAKILWAAPSTTRLIPNIALALGEIMMAAIIYIAFIIVAAAALFTIIGGYILLGGGQIVVPMMVIRWLTPLSEGYFNWLMRTGVVILFFYLVLGIAAVFAANWNTTLMSMCGPVSGSLPSPLLGTAPASAPVLACSAPIPVDTLLTLLADTLILTIIALGIPFAAGAMVSHGVNLALEHVATSAYLAGIAQRASAGVARAIYRTTHSSSNTSQSTLQQRLTAGAQAAARVASSPPPAPPSANAYGVQPTKNLNGGSKPTTKI